ncbi:hypothetical protein [Oceaniserpentilla sp. 4NH20-0058]|uniref:hypothetical protein n=1 Tax=Oceaniserpentilla sp. 4NH20-0058 TaxID=3127660 RepID=UPI0033418301
MRILLSLVICLSLSACSGLTPIEQRNLLDNTPAKDVLSFEPLPVGMQEDPDLSSGVIDINGKKSFYKAYELPKGHGSFVIQLRTYIQKSEEGDGFFYPVIELYNYAMEQVDIQRPQLRFTQFSSAGRYAAVPVRLNPDIGYVVIRTEPKLFGQEASYTTNHEGASWSYSVSPFSKRKPAAYLPLGHLELLTPDEDFPQPFEKLSGPFWQFAFDKGGYDLATAEDYLPDLTLGGGPMLSMGYSFAVPSRPSSSIRASLGFGYLSVGDKSGASHSQFYGMSDLLWVESNQVSSLGLGLTFRGGHQYTLSGDKYKFDPTFGPKVFAEIRGAMGVSLGAQLSWLTFTRADGEKYTSNQAGIFFTKLY